VLGFNGLDNAKLIDAFLSATKHLVISPSSA